MGFSRSEVVIICPEQSQAISGFPVPNPHPSPWHGAQVAVQDPDLIQLSGSTGCCDVQRQGLMAKKIPAPSCLEVFFWGAFLAKISGVLDVEFSPFWSF